MVDQSSPAGFRTILAREDEFALVLDARRQAYAEIVNRIGSSGASMSDEFDGLPNSRSYLLYSPDRQIAGTVRASVHVAQFHWATLPLSKYHTEAMAGIANQQIPTVQSSMLGVLPEYQDLGQLPTLSLVRAVLGTALAFGADHFVTLVEPRPARRKFWGRIGWRPLDPPVPHPFAKGGVSLLIGSVAESLEIARQLPEFHTLTEFTLPLSTSGSFPEEV
jgi:hypothetical protein